MASQQSQCSPQDLAVSSPSLWTQPCTDQHLWRMSQLISDWREMAPALGLTRTDEMNIMEYAPHSLPAQRVEMLRTWRRKLGTAATYSRLADAFSVCGKQDLVDAITELVTAASAESAYDMLTPSIHTSKHTHHSPSPSATTHSGVTASPSTPAHQHPLSPAMQRYVAYLKNVYKNKTTPVYDKEHSLLQVKAKSFINIALVHKEFHQYMNDSIRNEMIMDRLHGHVDAIQKTKTELPMSKVCKKMEGDLARSVLVEGAPGVGKTTFAYELCKRWARGEILWEWAAVVLIKLRDHKTRTAQSMDDLLCHPRREVQQAVVDELIDHNGECMLLILDGYDELTDSQKESTSVIQQIMSRDLLCQSTLMVTSRPLATRTLHDNFVQSIDQHIEVLGFTEKNIEEYIQSACGDKPELVEDFKSYLSSHPFSSALMFNPLQCAIVTDLYRSHWESGNKGFAPKTLTELYTGLVHIMLLRYLTQHPVYKAEYWRIKDLSDLPEEVSQQLKTVTELAAEGIEKRQYVFDELDKSIPSETLGFLQREEVVASGIGISTSHNFLHLTLQEYLAAVNYSQQYSSPEQLSQLLTRNDLFPLNNFLQYYGMKREPTLYSSATHWPVVLFVAGRNKLRGVPTNIFKTGFHDRYHLTIVEVSLLHLLYETQSPQLIQSTLVTSKKYLSVSGSSALDWFVIGYCIANSTSTWRVEINGNDCSPKYFDQLVMGLRLGSEECSGECKIRSLHISGHWTRNWKILSKLQPHLKSVTEMKLVVIKEREQSDLETSNLKSASEEVSACYPMLEELIIENVEICYSSTLLIFISQHNNLHILSLNQCNLSSIATSSLIHFLQSSNNRLHELTLEHCTIQIPDHIDSVAIFNYQLKLTSPMGDNFSLDITGSLYAINYMLSQPDLFYANTLTILKIETSLYPNLKELITSEENDRALLYYLIFHVILQQNNLRILSLKRYYLTCDIVRSLIHSLQSSHCGLQELTLEECISDHTHTTTTSSKLKLKSLDSGNVSLEFTGLCCDISHWLSQLSSYTQLTELILHLGRQDSITADTPKQNQLYQHVLESLKIASIFRIFPRALPLSFPGLQQNNLQEMLLYHHMLESLKIGSMINHLLYLPLSIPQFIELQQNNLHTLSLSMCKLSSDVTRSLIHSLQSPNCRLHKLKIDHCKISTSENTQLQNAISTKNNATLCSLVATNSLCVLNDVLSGVLFTQMTELSLCITTVTDDSSEAEVLRKIPVSCPVLKTVKIDSSVGISLPLSIPQFIGSQQNNLHTLSMRKCILNSDVTRSLIHSLRSPHCKLYKLALYDCTIPTTDHTQLTTAIVSSTTITHLLLIDENIDTPSLTALASGLKHNTTMEQLAVDKYYHDSTKEHFQLLIDAVDSSAVKKLWLNDHSDYRKWFSDYTHALSSKHVDIEWYSYYHYDLYSKW